MAVEVAHSFLAGSFRRLALGLAAAKSGPVTGGHDLGLSTSLALAGLPEIDDLGVQAAPRGCAGHRARTRQQCSGLLAEGIEADHLGGLLVVGIAIRRRVLAGRGRGFGLGRASLWLRLRGGP